MKIWKAELYLIDKDVWDNDNYEIIFDFESYGNDYEVNEKKGEYVHFEDWIGGRIPINMKLENTLAGIKIIQGFIEEKTEEEQEKIKQDMIDYMRECLIKEKNKIVESYNNKINALN